MAQTKRCPHCGNENQPHLGSDHAPQDCMYCGERIQWTMRDGWVVAVDYDPMSRTRAEEVIARYTPFQPVSMTADNAAELAEAILVLAGATRAHILATHNALLGLA